MSDVTPMVERGVAEALVHARWHRALDNPTREPWGPIRRHITAALTEAYRAGYTSAGNDPQPLEQLALAWHKGYLRASNGGEIDENPHGSVPPFGPDSHNQEET